MNIGPLDWRVAIEYPAVTGQDPDYGTDIIGWVLLAAVWANVEDVLPSRSEAVKQGLVIATNQTRIRLRYRSDIDSSMRLVLHRPDPIIYQIIAGPAELGRKEGIEFVVERYSS